MFAINHQLNFVELHARPPIGRLDLVNARSLSGQALNEKNQAEQESVPSHESSIGNNVLL